MTSKVLWVFGPDGAIAKRDDGSHAMWIRRDKNKTIVWIENKGARSTKGRFEDVVELLSGIPYQANFKR